MFAVTDVREVRLVTGYGKHKGDSEIALVYRNGTELRFGRTKHAAAVTLFEEAQAFFRPDGTARFRYATAPSRLAFAGGIACLVAAVVLGVLGARKRILDRVRVPTAKVERTLGEQAARRKRWIMIGGAGAAMLAVLAIMFVIEAATQGQLALDCQTRCRLDGLECMPGATLETALDPGDYTVEIWQGAGSALWKRVPVHIEVGETTRVVCAP